MSRIGINLIGRFLPPAAFGPGVRLSVESITGLCLIVRHMFEYILTPKPTDQHKLAYVVNHDSNERTRNVGVMWHIDSDSTMLATRRVSVAISQLMNVDMTVHH
jgi:hypothetical protein